MKKEKSLIEQFEDEMNAFPDLESLERSNQLAKDVIGDPVKDIIIPGLVDPDGTKKKRILAKINDAIKNGRFYLEPSHDW